MYQTAASEVVRTLVEDCLGVPLLLYQRKGRSLNTSLVYENQSQQDEVEDLFLALQEATKQFDGIQAVSSGAILSTYQRVRIEHVCSRLGLTSLSYLWRLLPQKELLKKMLNDGIEAVVVRAACPPGLIPRRHLNKTLRFLWDTGLLERLHQRYQFHVCGEGGEYESLVIDSPLYKKKLVLDEVEIDETDDGVGDLRILRCHATEKTEDDIPLLSVDDTKNLEAKQQTQGNASSADHAFSTITPIHLLHLPHIQKGTGGLFHVSEIMASVPASCFQDPTTTEAELAVKEACEVLEILRAALERQGATAQDVLFVHLYLSEISHFASINSHYQAFFGTLLPPSRSCVAVGKGTLPGGRRVLLDCLVQSGSGEYLRHTDAIGSNFLSQYAEASHATKTSKLREVLHVQSISHWAPVCVGPYSQVNTLRGGVHLLAGQIGLIPATMQLQSTWNLQLHQCWKNVAAVLDALGGGTLEHLLSGMIYVAPEVSIDAKYLDKIQSITAQELKENGSIVAGRVDSLIDESELYGGYEDQRTWEEMKGAEEEATEETCFPILVVAIPEMPKGAVVEVEVIASTEVAARFLDTKDGSYSTNYTPSDRSSTPTVGWNTGHEFEAASDTITYPSIRIDASLRALSHQGAAIGLVSASATQATAGEQAINMIMLIQDMLHALSNVMSNGRSGLVPSNIIHLRLFHVATSQVTNGIYAPRDDGLHLRCAFQSAVSQWGTNLSLPALSVVPVHSIDIINGTSQTANGSIIYCLQALLLDPVHLETDIWINKDREYTTHLGDL